MRSEGEQVPESLRQRLQEALIGYRRSIDEYRTAISASSGNSTGVEHRAVLIHEQSRRNFVQALKDFNDFIQHQMQTARD
jgi:hypothetical protein